MCGVVRGLGSLTEADGVRVEAAHGEGDAESCAPQRINTGHCTTTDNGYAHCSSPFVTLHFQSVIPAGP